MLFQLLHNFHSMQLFSVLGTVLLSIDTAPSVEGEDDYTVSIKHGANCMIRMKLTSTLSFCVKLSQLFTNYITS